MRTAVRHAIALFLFCLPLAAADPIYGTWLMRKEDQNTFVRSQMMRVEQVGGATRFTFELDVNGQQLSYYYVTKLDGAPVDAISGGKAFSKVAVKRINPYQYDTTSKDGTSDQHFTLTISKDGKTLATDGASVTSGKSTPVHLVFNRK